MPFNFSDTTTRPRQKLLVEVPAAHQGQSRSLPLATARLYHPSDTLMRMTYSEAIKYLYARGHELETLNLGLARIQALTEAAGLPQQRFPAVLIAGTNGKGSTAAMTFAIARAAGLRVGLYTSPHLVEITERIRLFEPNTGTRDISQDEFAHYATEVRTLGERLLAEGRLTSVPSLFEQLTMLAFLYFADRQVELAVLEVGLGGRLDATNVSVPVVTAITPIDYDHQRHLGNTLTEIAGEKTGIIKADTPLIVAPQKPEVMQIITARARELNAPVVAVEEKLRAARSFQVDKDFSVPSLSQPGACRLRYSARRAAYDTRLSLRGGHQVLNALTALYIAEALAEAGFAITPSAIEQGLQQTDWPGRLEWIRLAGSAPLLLDGAHNPAGARVVRKFLEDFCANRSVTIVFGAMSDKPFGEMEEILFPAAQQFVAARVNNPRAAGAHELAQLAEKPGARVLEAESVLDALRLAQRVTPLRGVICACGSLYLVGEIKQLIKEGKL
jgi:dihydrofolate synthase / folylpolyglutamate synthase